MEIDRLKEHDGRKKRGKGSRDQKQMDFPDRRGDASYRGRGKTWRGYVACGAPCGGLTGEGSKRAEVLAWKLVGR